MVQAVAIEVAAHRRRGAQRMERRPQTQVAQRPQTRARTEVDDRVLPRPAEQRWNRALSRNLTGVGPWRRGPAERPMFCIVRPGRTKYAKQVREPVTSAGRQSGRHC